MQALDLLAVPVHPVWGAFGKREMHGDGCVHKLNRSSVKMDLAATGFTHSAGCCGTAGLAGQFDVWRGHRGFVGGSFLCIGRGGVTVLAHIQLQIQTHLLKLLVQLWRALLLSLIHI